MKKNFAWIAGLSAACLLFGAVACGGSEPKKPVKLTEVQFKAALAATAEAKNLTETIEINSEWAQTFVIKYDFDEKKLSHHETNLQGDVTNTYFFVTENEIECWCYYDSKWEKADLGELEYTQSNLEETFAENDLGRMALAASGVDELYGQFVWNEEADTYTYAHEEMEIVLTFLSGKLESFTAEGITCVFSDYGKTKVEIPDIPRDEM